MIRTLTIAIAATFLTATAANAATLYWNGDSTNNTWNTSDANWNTAIDGSGDQVAWTNGDDAVFDGYIGYYVRWSGAIEANSITMTDAAWNGITDNGGGSDSLTVGAGGISNTSHRNGWRMNDLYKVETSQTWSATNGSTLQWRQGEVALSNHCCPKQFLIAHLSPDGNL